MLQEILDFENMKREKRFIQHANVSTYDHSISVATMSLTLAAIFELRWIRSH